MQTKKYEAISQLPRLQLKAKMIQISKQSEESFGGHGGAGGAEALLLSAMF